MKAHGYGKFAYEIFVDFQKAFSTVDYSTLLSNLCRYGIHGFANKWFVSYLPDCKQFVAINDFASSIPIITCGVP